VTAPSYTATAYAICASDSANYAGGVNGQGIFYGYTYNGAVGNTNDVSKEACCNSCAANPVCAGMAFYGGFAVGQQCSIFSIQDDQCTVDRGQLGAAINSGYAVDQAYFISNGNCGRYTETSQT
jgi:hypothetical protein